MNRFHLTGSMSTSLDSIPAKMTNATELRSSANRYVLGIVAIIRLVNVIISLIVCF